MQTISKIFLLIMVYIWLGSASHAQTSPQEQRELFIQAEKALKQHNIPQYQSLKSRLLTYSLYPYLEYKELRQNLASQSNTSIKEFLSKYSQTPLANRLLSAWLTHLAKHQRWSTFIDFYPGQSRIKLTCHYLNALLQTGKSQQAWPKITKVWLHEKSQPRACDPIFKQWQKAGYQTTALTWQRIALAIGANQIRLARFLAKKLPDSESKYFKQWLKVRRYPETLSLKSISKEHPFRQQAFAQGVQKLARKDLPKAISLWNILKENIIFDAGIIAQTERVFSLQFLDKPLPEQFDYLVFAQPCDHDTKLQEIRIRAALLNNRWDAVLQWLNVLPESYRNKDRWRYWKARSLQMLGQTKQALSLFQKVAKKRSYYGFLASDILNKDYHFNHNSVRTNPETFNQVKNLPSMVRAKELIALNRTLEARQEWFFISALLDDDELLAAAQLAHQWKWHDRAILTLAKAQYWNDLTIRFPLEHKQQVNREAKNTDIDQAWIYAMMRQESAFMKDARSPVGAMGLMQLMPKTAKAIAKTLNQKPPKSSDLFKPNRNIQLGTAYLNQVYNRLNKNPILAIAAYNAGPHRIKKWLPEQAMPADVWIELIPYKETRKYVKSVLAYSVIYENKLGHKARMSDRMPNISAPKPIKQVMTALK